MEIKSREVKPPVVVISAQNDMSIARFHEQLFRLKGESRTVRSTVESIESRRFITRESHRDSTDSSFADDNHDSSAPARLFHRGRSHRSRILIEAEPPIATHRFLLRNSHTIERRMGSHVASLNRFYASPRELIHALHKRRFDRYPFNMLLCDVIYSRHHLPHQHTQPLSDATPNLLSRRLNRRLLGDFIDNGRTQQQ